MENLRPLSLRYNPSPDHRDATEESIQAVTEYISQYPADERPIELAILISRSCNRLEERAEPEEASRYHALGFHALEQVQHTQAEM